MTRPLAELDWIAADWGTTALRVWAVRSDGSILATTSSQDGMGTLTPERYEPALLKLVGGWLPEPANRPVPVLVCGMAGARQGWKEAAYRSVPCAPVRDGRLTPVATRDRRLAVSIVPGLCQAEPADVMRGEETQLAGLAKRIRQADATVCMPGTHSKWVEMTAGEVRHFTTFMTGELFAVLSRHSILRHSVDATKNDRQAFLGGVQDMLAHPETLTAELFSIRASALIADTSAAASRSRLSGLLIGAELAVARKAWKGQAIHLVGAGPLAETYADALSGAGAVAVVEDAQALTLAGLGIARAALSGAIL